MKREILFVNFLLLSFFNFLYGQDVIDSSNIYCKYEVSFLIDSADVSTMKYENAILLIGNNISLFRSHVKHESDSLRDAVLKESAAKMDLSIMNNIGKIQKPKFFPEVYKKDDVVKIYDRVFIDYYVFESDKIINWKLLPETKVISTFLCRKAIGRYGNRNIIAWYTMNVPISEGPYNFKGLPGLIIEVYDENKYFHFVLKQLKKATVLMQPEKKALETTYEKFVKKRKEFIDNPSGVFKSRVPLVLKDQMSKTKNDEYDSRMKKNNNYLD